MEAELDYCDKVLKGIVDDDENMLALIYRSDYEHLWDDIGIIQANPLEIEANYEIIRNDRKKALVIPEAREEYLTKAMNYFVPSNSGDTYVEPEDVQAVLQDPSTYNWEGKDVYVGMDLALSGDNVGIAMTTFDRDLNKFVTVTMAFIPVLRLDEKVKLERCDYRRYIENGTCVACGGKKISYGVVEDYILNLEDEYKVRILGVGYDSWNAESTKQRLERFGYETIEVKQNSSVTYPAAKRLREDIMDHDVILLGDGLLKENLCNAKKFEDANMSFYINKKKSLGKVDLAVSIINSMVLWIDDMNDDSKRIYESRGLFSV